MKGRELHIFDDEQDAGGVRGEVRWVGGFYLSLDFAFDLDISFAFAKA